MNDLDKSRLIATIAARLKIRLDEDDPAFVLVELNRLVLDQTVRDAMRRVRELGPVRRQPKSEEVAKEFAALVAQSLNAKLPKPPTPPGTGPNVLTWSTALACMLLVTLLAMAVGYELGGSMSCGLK